MALLMKFWKAPLRCTKSRGFPSYGAPFLFLKQMYNAPFHTWTVRCFPCSCSCSDGTGQRRRGVAGSRESDPTRVREKKRGPAS